MLRPDILGNAQRRRWRRPTGIVDQDVDAAEFFIRLVCRFEKGRAVGNVHGKAQRADGARGLFNILCAARQDGEFDALLGERFRYAAAEAPATAENESSSSSKSEIHSDASPWLL